MYRLNGIKIYEASKQDQANDMHLVNSNCFTERCLIIQKSERIKYGKNS